LTTTAPAAERPRAPDAKFRQAAFVYLHTAILYEIAAYHMMGTGLLPMRFGPPVLWLAFGAAIGAFVVYGLLRWRTPWFPRIIWIVHSGRLPALVKGAFFAGDEARLGPAFYITAILVVLITLWMLARAGWDL